MNKIGHFFTQTKKGFLIGIIPIAMIAIIVGFLASTIISFIPQSMGIVKINLAWIIVVTVSLTLFKYIFYRKSLKGTNMLEFSTIKPVKVVDYMKGVGLFFIVALIANMGVILLSKDVMPMGQFSMATFASTLVMTTIAITMQGTGEEIIFRGFFVSYMQKIKFQKGTIIVVTAIVFALTHIPAYNLGQSDLALFRLFFAFVAGVIFAQMRFLTGNIWLASGAHVIWNATEKAFSSVIIPENQEIAAKANILNGFKVDPSSNFIFMAISLIIIVFLGMKIKKKNI
jgi:membrane protease YdiL (CAAX protease family)